MIENGFAVKGPIRMGDQAYIASPKAPTQDDELVNKKYVDSHSTSSHYLRIQGETMIGQIDMSGQKITGLGQPGDGGDVVPKSYLTSKLSDFKRDNIDTLTTGITQAYADAKYYHKGYEIDMGNQKVTNVGYPTGDQDVVNKSYMESHVPKGVHRLLLHFKGDFVSNGSAMIHKDNIVSDYFFVGTSNKREVTITIKDNIGDGFYAYDMDIRRRAGKDKGMDIQFYGAPNDTEFI